MNTLDVPIASPCGADWRSMTPADKKRFCDSCKKYVHDLSEMNEAEARAILHAPPAEGLCVRYLHDVHGNLLFKPAPIAPALLVRARRFAAMAALPMSMAACSSAYPMMGAPPPPAMGAVACPLPQRTATPSASATVPDEPIPVMGEPAASQRAPAIVHPETK